MLCLGPKRTQCSPKSSDLGSQKTVGQHIDRISNPREDESQNWPRTAGEYVRDSQNYPPSRILQKWASEEFYRSGPKRKLQKWRFRAKIRAPPGVRPG